jgi:hypothetical protein
MEALNTPTSAVPTADGGFLLAELGALSGPDTGARIRKVSASGTITTVAGTGVPGFSGDGGPATSAQLYQPTAAVPTSDGGFLISEYGNCVVRKVSAAGTITTAAGVAPSSGPTYHCGNSGSGGPATAAQLYQPTAAVPVSDGSFLIGSFGSPPGTPANDAQVNRVLPSGTILSAFVPVLANQSAPKIAGNAVLNGTLMCSQGTWAATPTSVLYQWNRNGAPIPSAAGSSYRAVAADVGQLLTCTVTASAGGATGSATSAPVTIARVGSLAPVCVFTHTSSTVRVARDAAKKKPKPPKNVLIFSFRCNQAAKVKIGGKIKETIKRKHHKTTITTIVLRSRDVQVKGGVTVTSTLALPKTAISGLKKGNSESATLTLVATNANGKGHASTTIKRIKPKA